MFAVAPDVVWVLPINNSLLEGSIHSDEKLRITLSQNTFLQNWDILTNTWIHRMEYLIGQTYENNGINRLYTAWNTFIG